MSPHIIKILGIKIQDGKVYEYFLKSDRYVYQTVDGKPNGWLCSEPAWERTLHKVLN